MDVLTAPFSRRRAMALAATLATSAAAARRAPRTGAQVTQAPGTATPSGTPVPPVAANPNPMPSTLAADASPAMRAVADTLVEGMQAHGIPGAAVGVLWADREEHATFGVESLSSLRPVTGQTLFQIGSLTKTFTSTVIWHLIDQGALSLDAPVRTWIPDLTLQDADAASRLSIGNLLDHSAGFYGDDMYDTGDDDGALARNVTERLPLLPQQFPLGEHFSYNNMAFSVLGRLIEVTTGTTYRAAMGSLLFGPLGLGNTLLEHSAVLQHPFSDGHVTMPINDAVVTTIQLPLWVERSVEPAGGIWTTTRDVLRYGRFHMAQGTVSGPANIVSPESLAQMREPAMPIPGTSLWMGRDWFVQDIEGIRIFTHSGDTLGQHTDFFAIPAYGFAIVVMANCQPSSTVTFAAVNAAISQIPELQPLIGKLGLVPALRIPADAEPQEATAEELSPYPGRYENPATSITINAKENALEFTIVNTQDPNSWHPLLPAPEPSPGDLQLFGPDLAGMPGGPKVPFVRDADGNVGWVSSGLRLIPRVASP